MREIDDEFRAREGDDIEKPPMHYVRKMYEHENEQLYDLAKFNVFSVAQLEAMRIGEFYNYLVKEMKDLAKLKPKKKK